MRLFCAVGFHRFRANPLLSRIWGRPVERCDWCRDYRTPGTPPR